VVGGDGEQPSITLFSAATTRPPNGNPAFVLLDYPMPKVDGPGVLRAIRGGRQMKPSVVMLTSSREEEDLVLSYRLGVNAYGETRRLPGFLEAVRQLGALDRAP